MRKNSGKQNNSLEASLVITMAPKAGWKEKEEKKIFVVKIKEVDKSR
ncbi:MAG: hypothetical protein ACUVR0_08100 [Candidatus Aminicenantales bacterium]